MYYRWRQRRTKRKAGNVSDFARRWGNAYGYMVVLDADSLMTGECLTTLVRLMEANPEAGILQTAPRACGHETFHARVLQFGSRAYGPLFTAGMHFWQLGESHYWGHNAILRMKPFIEHCGLPALPGNGSLSGEVLSHDFVEAALMRRAGWKVWVIDDLPGSYEQVPPNLLAELQRDRRWCHGNLQNARLMFEPSLHAVHRSVFLTGVLAYASAPLWLGFLLLSTLLFTRHAHDIPIYFIEPYQMFPIWPSANLKLILTLFGLTGVLLLAPKAMSLLVILLRRRAWCYGGVESPDRQRVHRVLPLAAAGAGPDAVPHPVLRRRTDGLEARVEVAAARRRRDELGRGDPASRPAHRVRAGLDRRDPCDRGAVPDLAVADHPRPARRYPAVGVGQPRRRRAPARTRRPAADSRRDRAAAGPDRGAPACRR